MRPPRFGRLRIPARFTTRWRARLRAQRRWWRLRLRGGNGAVLFPAAGEGMVAVHQLETGRGPAGHPRIAILHATAGAGHKSAAQSIAAAIAQASPGAAVSEVDTLVFASRLYRSTYAASYNAMAARAPRLWGALYHSWASTPVNRGTASVRLLDRLNLRRLVRVTEHERPDAIVCTHFLPVEALSPRRGRGHLDVPLFCVITDFAAHPFWAFPHVDRYFVASDEVAAELAGHGVPGARIEVTGIPVDPRFAVPLDRDAARARLQLDPGRPVVLVMGGGGGVGPLVEMAGRLGSLQDGPQVLVACGTNEKLHASIAALPEARGSGGRPAAIRALGFSREVDVLLAAADVLVGKAGGLTCSEALVRGVPMVIFKPTPGQEVRNATYLERHGAALHADSVQTVFDTVARWLGDPAELARRREAAIAIARPQAAADIARRVLTAVPAAPGRSAS